GPFVAKNHLREKYGATFETITGWGIGGPVRSQLARVSTMTLGGRLTMRGIVARLSTQKSGVLASTSIDGLIGGDVLRRFTVTFDYSRGVMLLEPNARFEKQDNWDGTGMWIGLRDDGFEVLDLVPGGPAAAAGVKKGDTILAIDGRPTRLLSLPVERLALYYDGRPRTLTLRLRADGAERTVHLVMKRLV
ncbi:MAG: PDZ domain-containing protein, partial [Acidobacteriota bacterium]